MKLEKAIENTEAYVKGEYRGLATELIESFRLGIEAIKVVQNLREDGILFDDEPLPGETED